MALTPAPTVHESLTEAFDQVVPAETPADVPAPVETPAPEVKAETPALEAPKTDDRPRGPDGKFVKAEEAPKPKEEARPAEAPKPKTPRPQSWKKELEQHWETLPPEVQSYVQEREKQYQTGVSTYKTEADRARTINEAIAPFAPMLQRSNIPVDKWIQQMGIAHHLISAGTPQERVQTVAQIIRNNGIDAQALIQVLSGQQPTYQQPQMQQQGTPLPQQGITPEQVEQTVQQALMKQQVEGAWSAFQADVAAGKFQHFEELKPTMAGLLQSGLATDYPSAYEAALAMPQHRHLQQPAPQPQTPPAPAAPDKNQQAQRARSQAVSVKSSTPSTMAPSTGPKGLRDTLSDAFDKAVSGRV